MDTMTNLRTSRRRTLGLGSLLLLLAVAATVLLGGGDHQYRMKKTFTPVFLPVYEIEAVSGSHVARLLNLPLPNVGVVPQAPSPVDINGDLLPDVTVAVNLIDANGIFNNPPAPGKIIAPNIEINRLFTAPLLNPGGDPLRINIKFTVNDLEGGPPIVLKFGYDTGPGGSIPPNYKAIVGGIENGFNPIKASIDTTGGLLIGLDPKLPDLGLTPQSSAYEGPLSTFVDINTGPSFAAKADMRFKPMPDLVNVTYGSDTAGQHFTYAHSSTGEVDLAAKANLVAGALHADVDSHIDRIPRQVGVDFLTGEGSGGVAYQSSVTSGRLPDLSATADVSGATARPIHARFDAEALPQSIKGQWSFPDGAPPSLHFEGSGQGIGAIEAHVQNYTGNTTAFTPYVPKEQQHVSIQAGPGGVLADDTLLSARLERLRGATVQGEADGSLTGEVNVGDGERALEVHGELDLRPAGKPYINATAKISPLPDSIKFAVNPAGVDESNKPTPTRIKYEPSESIDVDTDAMVGLPGTTGAVSCGQAGTACGSLQLRNIPTLIEARLLNTETENRVDIDAIQRPGAAPLDVFGNVVMGPINSVGGPAANVLAEPIRADISVQGLPQYLRMRSLKDAQQNLKRFSVRTCDVDYSTEACKPGTDDKVAEMTFDVRNFATRPANLPAPPQSGPIFVTVSARGEDAPSQRVHFQATGRMTDFKEVTYLGTPTMTGVKADIGGNQDFRTFVDVKNIDVNGGSPTDGRMNVDGDFRINKLPAPLTFCFAQNGRAPTAAPTDPITAACENPDPFGDGTIQRSPLTVAYRAPAPFDVIADLAIQGDFPFQQPELPVDFGRFDRVAAHLGLTNIPASFTAYMATAAENVFGPDANTSSATRILTVAPGANNTKLEMSAQLTTPGVSCLNPDPNGGAICADVLVDKLPEFASILAETVSQTGGAPGGDAVVEQRVQAKACDFQYFTTETCKAGTAGEIGEIKVGVRAHAGSGAENPVYQPPAVGPHVFAQATIKDLSNFEVEAGLRVLQLRGLSFHQDPEGLQVDTDLGNGVDPLTIHGFADLRQTDNLVPDSLQASILADVAITPLPAQLSFKQSGPGKNQTKDTVISFDASSNAIVTLGTEIREVGAGDACGDRGTVCANLTIDSLPSHLDATIHRAYSAIEGNERDSETQIFVNQDGGPGHDLDILGHLAMGLPVDTPLVGEGPLVADLKLLDLPQHISADMQSREVLQSNGSDLEIRSSALERFQFHTCTRDFTLESCDAGTNDEIGLVEISVRTFDLRPTDFPTPPASHTPMYIGLTGRGREVEGFVSIPHISEVQFLNRGGLTGATARLGGTTPAVSNDFDIRIDVEDLPIGDSIQMGDQTIYAPLADLKANIDITPFPGEVSFCLRQGGVSPVPLIPSGIPFTPACEDPHPFAPGDTPQQTPLSIGFHSNVAFDASADVDLSINGNENSSGPAVAADQQRFTGHLALGDLPSDLVFHFLQPRVTSTVTPSGIVDVPSGPFHAVIRTNAASGLDLDFAAAYLVGDGVICKDPRPTASATCLSGKIDDLPTGVEFFYDPDLDLSDPSIDLNDPAQTQNFLIHAEGGSPTRIHDLEVSTVEPQREADGALTSPPKSKVLLATADLDALPLPFDVLGTLDLPKEEGDAPTAVFEVQNGNKIPDLKIHVQNYISPNPTAGAFVPARAPETNGLNTYELSAIMRGDAFRLDAEIPGVQKVGLKAIRGTNHLPIGTNQVSIGFGQDFNVRAYVDLQPDPSTRAIADVLVHDIPAATEACIRGPREGGAIGIPAYPGQGTFCDDPAKIADNEGALEIQQLPITPGRKLDVDAFARLQFGGGSSIVAARLSIDNIPQVIQARFPGGSGSTDVEVNSFSRLFAGGPLIPDGIDKIALEAATFDLAHANTPYPGALPYVERVNNAAPFPAKAPPADGREYIHAAADIPSKNFHVRAQIGRTDGQPSTQFESLLYSSKPCPTPLNNPVGYPLAPVTADTDYTCIRVLFDQHSAGINPLSLSAVAYLGDGMVARLRDAGLSDVPDWLQFQLASDNPYLDKAGKRGWRRPCGPAYGPGAELAGASCMPAMLRFDQPNNPYIFGVAEVAKITDLGSLETVDPIRTAPNFDLVPTATGWGNGFFDNSGIAAKILDFDGNTLTNTDDDRFAAKVSFRLPIPQGLTVDQPQSFKGDQYQRNKDKIPIGGAAASDSRFHFKITRADGTTVDHIGDLAAMAALVESGVQALVTQPCAAPITAANSDDPSPDCPEYAQGVQLPGEIGMTIYNRDNITALPNDGDTERMRASSLMQVDGRVSTPISIGARIVAGGAEVAKGIRLGDVEAAIKNIPAETGGANPHNPSFRLRAEIVKDQDKPKESEPAGPETQETNAPAVFSFTSTINIKVNRIFAGFDFHPDGNDLQARRLDAVIHLNGTKIGTDIGGFASIDPAVATVANYSAAVTANIDPLDFNMRSVWNFASAAEAAVHNFITDTLGGPDWLADVIDWLISPVIDFIEGVMNALPIQIRLKSALLLQFKLERVDRFTMRANLLHVNASTHGPGKAEIGPIDWYIDEFSGGLDLDIPPLDIPDWIDWLPGVPDEIDIPPILLVGYAYAGGLPVGSFGVPLQIDIRKCGSGFPGVLTSVVPYSGGANGVAITQGNSPQDVAIWIGTDPRMSLDGVLLRLLSIVGTTVGDFLLDIVAGPIICGVFDVPASNYQAINTGTLDPEAYNPGNAGTVAFDGNPVPGQPGQPAALPPEVAVPTTPVVFPPLPVSDPGSATPPTPPTALPALYSGPSGINLSTPMALCGVHEFNDLTVSAAVTVATTSSGANSTTTGPDCPAGSEGTLELRANTMLITPSGSVTGNGISSDVGHFAAEAVIAPYRATGSSGGTYAGVGFNGSAPSAGIRAYDAGTVDTTVYPGGPGSSVDGAYTRPDQAGVIPSAGAGGKGGGAIVLKADGELRIEGTVSANGANGAGNLGGACDADNNENLGDDFDTGTGGPGDPIVHHIVYNDPGAPTPIAAGSVYEHTGSIGAGGGAGGGIALQARNAINVTGTLQARGGNGGGGLLGAGGGGGGGVIKALAPIQTGISQSGLDSATTAGLNGAINNGAIGPCAGVPGPTNPTRHDTPPPVVAPLNGTPQETDGTGVIYAPPVARLQPYGPFWWPGGAGAPAPGTFPAYYLGGGGTGGDPTTLVTCAVKFPTLPSSGYLANPDPAYLAPLMSPLLPFVTYNSADPPVAINHGSLPTVDSPCGTKAATDAAGAANFDPGASIVEVSPRTTFSGAVVNPATVDLDINASGFYGLYTTAIRAQTPGNDCFVHTGPTNDATDCLIEPLSGIEWVVGVDAARPSAAITAPTNGSVFNVNAVTLGLSSSDQTDLSGFSKLECQLDNDGGTWRTCSDGDTVSLLTADGPSTIQVRGYDKAGNVSAPISSTTVFLDRGQPTAAAHTVGGTSQAGWFRVAPSVVIDSYASASPARLSPYIYRFDNGFETDCPNDPSPTPTCTVPAATVAGLSVGAHDFNFTGVNGAGVRRDPMQSIPLKLDNVGPVVELATVPTAPNRLIGLTPWFDEAPFLVVSAIDQFGASGVNPSTVEIKVGGAPFVTYDPLNPPKAPQGTTTVCVRATDVAGTTTAPPCKVIRVDSDAPGLTVTPSAAPNGSGWYTSSPSFSVAGYDDGTGVGPNAGTSPLRYRVDNDLSTDCAGTSCTIPASRFTTGTHAVHASAVDQFDNRSLERPRPTPAEIVKVDLEAPIVVPQLRPATPDGQNGWYHTRPWLTLSAVDPGAGSGVSSISYSLTGPGGPFAAYTGPINVGPGSSAQNLCWKAQDVAGNVTATGCKALLVDTDRPTTTLTPSSAPGPSGWYTSSLTVTVGTSDPAPGSTVDQAFDSTADLCNELSPAADPKQPSGTCVSLDDGPWVPKTGVLTLGEGIHTVRSYAVDVAGRRGPVTEGTYKVDKSAPYVTARLVAPAPALNGWYRNKPMVVLRANDGEQGSGLTDFRYKIDGGALTPYLQPFEVPEGTHTVAWTASDLVGTRTGSMVVKVDLTHPKAIATTPDPVLWLRLLGLGGPVKLQYKIGDALGAGDAPTANLKVAVILQDVTGNIIRRIDGGTVNVTKGVDKAGFVTWDGKDGTLLNLVPLGVYYYRVVVIDEAGNVTHSGEAKPITIRLL